MAPNRTSTIMLAYLLLGCGGTGAAVQPSPSHVVRHLEPTRAGRSAGPEAEQERAEAAHPAYLEDAAKYGLVGLTEAMCTPKSADAAVPYPCSIQRVVRASFGRMLACYESRRQSPNVQGRVMVRFIIDASGHVTEAARNAGTTLPDANVVACVVQEFARLSFPPPYEAESTKKATVVYPVIFSNAPKP